MSVKLTVWVIGVILALLVVRWLWSIVTAAVQIGLIVAVIAGLIFVVGRFSEKR